MIDPDEWLKRKRRNENQRKKLPNERHSEGSGKPSTERCRRFDLVCANLQPSATTACVLCDFISDDNNINKDNNTKQHQTINSLITLIISILIILIIIIIILATAATHRSVSLSIAPRVREFSRQSDLIGSDCRNPWQTGAPRPRTPMTSKDCRHQLRRPPSSSAFVHQRIRYSVGRPTNILGQALSEKRGKPTTTGRTTSAPVRDGYQRDRATVDETPQAVLSVYTGQYPRGQSAALEKAFRDRQAGHRSHISTVW